MSNGGSFDTAEDVKNGVKGYFYRGSFGSAVDGLYSDVSHGSGCKQAALFCKKIESDPVVCSLKKLSLT